MSEQTPTNVETRTFCYKHPDRETLLRCNRCNQPICISCAMRTPTGYRCKTCVRGAQKVFETAQTTDYLVAVIVAGLLSMAGSSAAIVLQFFTILIAPVIGFFISEAVRWAVRKRRSALLFQVAAGGALLGALPLLVVRLVFFLFALANGGDISGLFGLIWPAVYAFLVVSTTYYRLSGIQVR